MPARPHRAFAVLTVVALVPGVSAESLPRHDRYGDPLPRGAVARLGTTRFRLNDRSAGVALSPDGRLLALGGLGPLRLVSSATGEDVRTIRLPEPFVRRICFSPDGKRFAALVGPPSLSPWLDLGERGGARKLIVGETAAGKILRAINASCPAFALSPDGRHLFGHDMKAGSSLLGDESGEGPVVCWDVDIGKEIWRSRSWTSFTLSADGKLLAGGDNNGSIHLWDAPTGRELRRLDGHRSRIRSLSFAPDGRSLVAASGVVAFGGVERPSERSVRLWDVATGKERWRRAEDAVTDLVRFAPDGRTVATVDRSRRGLHLWDAADGEPRQHFPGPPNDEPAPVGHCAFTFSPDGKTLFYNQTGGVLYQWEVAAGRETRRWDAGESFDELFVSPDGKTLFGRGTSVRTWDVATGKERHEPPAHRQAVRSLEFSPDGRRLVTQDVRGECRLWDARSGEPLGPAPLHPLRNVLGYGFGGDGRSWWALHEEAVVRVWGAEGGEEVRRFRVGDENTVQAWRKAREGGEGLFPFDTPFRQRIAVFHPGTNLLAVAHADQDVHLWDVGRGRELCRLSGHRGGLQRLAFSPRGDVLLSQGEDDSLRFWAVPGGAELRRLQIPMERTAAAFSPDGRLLAWEVGDGGIRLWDVAARKEVRKLAADSGAQELCFQGDGKLLASACGATVRLWDTAAGEELSSFSVVGKSPSVALRSCPDGRVLACCQPDADDAMRLRDVVTQQDLCAVKTQGGIDVQLSPDGRTLATFEDGIVLRERATGGVVAEITEGFGGHVTALAFSPDGKRLATAATDTTVLLWDWPKLAGLRPADGRQVGDPEMNAAWADLASADARKGYRAVGTLIAGGERAVSLLRQRLRLAVAEDWKAVRRLIDQLDDNDFAAREKASQDLLRRGAEARLFLCRAAKGRRSLEARRRLEQILADPQMKRPAAESRRAVRAVQVLEEMGGPAARELLASWSRGDENSWLTQEARAALRRR